MARKRKKVRKGQTKVVKGKKYKLNKQSRWERIDDKASASKSSRVLKSDYKPEYQTGFKGAMVRGFLGIGGRGQRLSDAGLERQLSVGKKRNKLGAIKFGIIGGIYGANRGFLQTATRKGAITGAATGALIGAGIGFGISKGINKNLRMAADFRKNKNKFPKDKQVILLIKVPKNKKKSARKYRGK